MQHRPLLMAAWLVALAVPAGAGWALPPGYSVVDVFASPTDPQVGYEPSIAVDPNNSNNIAITSSYPAWVGMPPMVPYTNHGIWKSADGGATWTRYATIPAPTGRTDIVSGCPCDQTIDAARGGLTVGTFHAGNNIFTGATSDLTQAAAWNWYAPGGMAQPTNLVSFMNGIDQPWVMVNRDPVNSNQDNVYVAYTDEIDSQVRVAVSKGTNPPNFAQEASPGAITWFCGPAGVVPGARLAGDASNGTIYCMWQTTTGPAPGTSTSIDIDYWLNRSTDGGATWSINGSSNPLQIAGPIASDQYDLCDLLRQPKFGTVNSLEGGIDTLAVDPSTGDVICVYGKIVNDPSSGAPYNQLFMVRVKAGSPMVVGTPVQVSSGQVDSALPGAAVTLDGVIGVLYDSTAGTDPVTGFPKFTVHLNTSLDGGATFAHDTVLTTFTSPAGDNVMEPDPNKRHKQRLMGDYQQLKAGGTWFFGTFVANRNAFAGNANVNDPVFVKAPSECQ